MIYVKNHFDLRIRKGDSLPAVSIYKEVFNSQRIHLPFVGFYMISPKYCFASVNLGGGLYYVPVSVMRRSSFHALNYNYFRYPPNLFKDFFGLKRIFLGSLPLFCAGVKA